MTDVAALPVMSLPDIAAALPKAGDGATGAESIFDTLLAALAPMPPDPASGPAPTAAPQPTPLSTGPSGAPAQQTILPDAVASLAATFGDANTVSLLPPSATQLNPSKPDTVLPSPIFPVSAGQVLPQDEIIAPVPSRPARNERTGANAPADKDTAGDALLALTMMVPQLLPAAEVTPAPVSLPAAEGAMIGNAAETAPPNPLPGVQMNAVPQKDVLNPTRETIPETSTSQPAKSAAAIPAAAAMPFVLPQAGDSAARLPSKEAPPPAAEKATTNVANRRGKTEAVAPPSKEMTSTAVAQAAGVDSSAEADRTQINSHGSSEPAPRPAQDVASLAALRSDNFAPPLAANGHASAPASNHIPLEVSGVTPANASAAPAPQSADTPLRLALSAPGVPVPASMDALALRIAAKSADGESQFQIRLDPPSLGRIEIHINMDSQGNAQAQLSADRPQTLEALQRDASSLERALKDAGLDLPGGLSFSLKGDGKSGGAWRDSQNSGRSRALQIDAVDAANKAAAISGLALTGHPWGADAARLDIRV